MANDWGSMEVLGLSEMDSKLEKMSNELTGKALFGALMFAATPMVKEAKAHALVASEPHKMNGIVVIPGLLSESIRKKRLPKSEHVGEFAQGAVVGIYIGKGKTQKLYPRYWHFIERGTSKMTATPFLRPAFDNNIELSVTRFKTKLAKNIYKYTE